MAAAVPLEIAQQVLVLRRAVLIGTMVRGQAVAGGSAVSAEAVALIARNESR
jgi:hypothetical protein